MKYSQEKLKLVLCSVTGASLAFSTGCDDRAAKQAEAKYYKLQEQALAKHNQQQEQTMERQNAEWERQVERVEAQDERYAAHLAKWEKHTKRVDGLLDRWDRLLVVLEERSGDQPHVLPKP